MYLERKKEVINDYLLPWYLEHYVHRDLTDVFIQTS